MKSQKRFALCIARNPPQISAHVQRARSVVHTGQPCFPCGQQVFKKYLKLKILMCFIWAAHLWLSTLASLYSAASHPCGERVCPHFEKRIFTWEKRWANELHSERHGHRGHRAVGGALRSVLLKALRSPFAPALFGLATQTYRGRASAGSERPTSWWGVTFPLAQHLSCSHVHLR